MFFTSVQVRGPARCPAVAGVDSRNIHLFGIVTSLLTAVGSFRGAFRNSSGESFVVWVSELRESSAPAGQELQ